MQAHTGQLASPETARPTADAGEPGGSPPHPTVVSARRMEARRRVEALTLRETRGEEPRFRSTYPIPGGLVSSTRYLLECAHRGGKPASD